MPTVLWEAIAARIAKGEHGRADEFVQRYVHEKDSLAGSELATRVGRPDSDTPPMSPVDGPRRGDGAEDTGTSTPEGAKDAEDGTRGTGDANSDGRRSDDSDDARGSDRGEDSDGAKDAEDGGKKKDSDEAAKDAEEEAKKTPKPVREIREALPDYVRSGQSLGPIEQIGATRRANLPEDTRTLEFTGPDVVAHLNSLVPGGKGKWEDTGVVQRRIDNAVHSLVGTGDTFTVRKGGKFYELLVRAVPQFDEMKSVKPSEESIKASAKTEKSTSHTSAEARDKSFSPQLATTSVPGLYVYVNPTLPGGFSETHLSEQSQKHGSEHKYAIKELHDVDVPMKFEFSLRDSKDRVVTRPAWSATSPAPSRTAGWSSTPPRRRRTWRAAGADRALQRPVHRQRARRRPLAPGQLPPAAEPAPPAQARRAGRARARAARRGGQRAVRDSAPIGVTLHTGPSPARSSTRCSRSSASGSGRRARSTRTAVPRCRSSCTRTASPSGCRR
ncbi:hypothetical protein [Saccharopolyspora gregorii]|uniref:Uncharacterized protein n=1 Tax=Saccharopolyspora gregorii TaxID=33914 RepID=A0ABP6S343_9PSEU